MCHKLFSLKAEVACNACTYRIWLASLITIYDKFLFTANGSRDTTTYIEKDQKTKKAKTKKNKKQIAYTYASVFKFVLFLLIYCMLPLYEKSSLLWFYCKFWYL